MAIATLIHMRLKTLLESNWNAPGVLKRFALELQQLMLEMPHMELSVKMTNVSDHTIELFYHDEPKLIQGKIKLAFIITGSESSQPGRLKYQIKFGNELISQRDELLSPAFTLFKLIQGGYHRMFLKSALISAFGTINVEEVDQFHLKKTDNAGFVITPPMSLSYLRDKAHMLHGNDIVNLQVFLTSDSKLRVNAYDAESHDHEFTCDSILDVQKQLAALIADAEPV